MKFKRNNYATHKKGWIVTKAILPQKIIETIERTDEILRHIDLPKKTSKNYIDHQHRLMYCIHILYNKYVNAEMHIDDHLEIGDKYKQYLFWGNRNYHFLLKILVDEMNILQPLKLKNGSLWGKKQVRRYTFNPDFLIGQKLETIFYERRTVAVKNSARPTQKPIPNDSIETNVQQVLEKATITLNQEEIVQLVNNRSNEVENKIRANTYTKGGKIKYTKDGTTKTISGQFKNKEQFIRYRTNLIIHNHINTPSNLVNESYNLPLTQPKRDSKAGRLYHQIISLPKVYYQYIRLDGERIGEIDMKNSQLCLFSHVLLRTNNNKSITGIEEELWNTMLSSLLEKESNQGNNLGAYLSSHFLDNNTKHWTESTPELSEWITATLNGELYKKIAYQIGVFRSALILWLSIY